MLQQEQGQFPSAKNILSSPQKQEKQVKYKDEEHDQHYIEVIS